MKIVTGSSACETAIETIKNAAHAATSINRIDLAFIDVSLVAGAAAGVRACELQLAGDSTVPTLLGGRVKRREMTGRAQRPVSGGSASTSQRGPG
jgi:hypothetical protein